MNGLLIIGAYALVFWIAVGISTTSLRPLRWRASEYVTASLVTYIGIILLVALYNVLTSPMADLCRDYEEETMSAHPACSPELYESYYD